MMNMAVRKSLHWLLIPQIGEPVKAFSIGIYPTVIDCPIPTVNSAPLLTPTLPAITVIPNATMSPITAVTGPEILPKAVESKAVTAPEPPAAIAF
ncbi:unnamed protein product [Sphagnum balticum]